MYPKKTLKKNLINAALAALLLLPAPLHAEDAPPSPMSFTFEREDYRKYGLGLYQVIHASGAITEGTVDKLTVFAAERHIEPGGEIYFDSSGGNRLEGMRLGRLIRQLGLVTRIGHTDPNQPGACVGACAFAFLGGTFRFMSPVASYGVHRFYRSQGKDQEFTLEQAPEIAQQMGDFMRDMGVSTDLYRYMAAPDSAGEIVLLNKDTLRALGVVNDGIISAEWLMADNHGLPYLRANVQNYKGIHSLSMVCDRQNRSMKGVGLMQAQDPDSLRRTASEEGLILDNRREPLSGQFVVDGPRVKFTFPITPKLAVHMMDASELGMYVKPNGIIYTAGFRIQQTAQSRQWMNDYVNECFGKQAVSDAKNL